MEDTGAYIKNFEAKFSPEAISAPDFNPVELLGELETAHEIKAYNAEKIANLLQDKLVEKKDIDNLISLLTLKALWNKDSFAFGQSCKDALGALSVDRVFQKMIQCVKFGKIKPTESLRRLATLRSFTVGKAYFDKTWGLGEIKRIDTFDMRIYLDFYGKPGHSMSMEYAAETLKTVPERHILMQRHADPDGFAKKLKEAPGEIVKSALESFGPSSVGRLQTLFANYGIVSEEDWRKFWPKARTALAGDHSVVIPVKRSDPITITADGQKRAFGDDWFEELAKMRDIPAIFSAVSQYEDAKSKPERSERASAILTDRLLFAIKGAFLFPPPLFTRLVLMAQRLGIKTSKDELAELLLEDDRFMDAGGRLPVGEAKEMVQFIAETRPDAVGVLFDRIPQMGYTLLKQLMATFWSKSKTAALKSKADATDANAEVAEAPAKTVDDPALLKALQDRVRDLLFSPSAPYTLVVWTLRENKWEDLKSWNLPSLYELLDHAIAICEDQAAAGEALQMQNLIRELFTSGYAKQGKARAATKKSAVAEGDAAAAQQSATKGRDDTWLASVFRQLAPLQQEALFMRLQSNQAIAEPRFQRMFVETMIAVNPALEAKRASSFDAPQEQTAMHYTSWRSFKNRQDDFRKLIEEEIPKNTQDISYARSLGDLRENAEYQYAKDQQRILLARREAWSVELEKMHGTSFAEFTPDFSSVEPATTVTIAKEDGSERVYSILGEWDNDDTLGIISCISGLAKALLGKKVGETAEIPSAVGMEAVTVKAIAALPQAVREWCGQPSAE